VTSRKPQIFDPTRPREPKYFTRIPDDVIEDTRLTLSDLGVFAHLLRRHWTDEKTLKITQAQLAKRCRMTVRKVRPHLEKLEKCGYITRDRDHKTWGGPTQITLTYELRPTLEMSADLPIARGSKRACDRTKRSHVVRTKRSAASKTETVPLLREIEERESSPEGGMVVDCASSGNPPSWDSRHQEVINLAVQRWGACNGDYIVGDLLRAYPVELVKEAIDRHWDKVGPKLRPSLLRGTCRGMKSDGWQPEVVEPDVEPAADAKPREIIWGP
jgi:uncharacterized protein YdaU (DUF1376 family)